jgi:hypothetical protein
VAVIILCDAIIKDDNRALCDQPAIWKSTRELLGAGVFTLFFCARHEDRARRPVPGVRLIACERLKREVN